MYRMNLKHQFLTSCDGDCFDDLSIDCRDEIMSSDDETQLECSSSSNNVHLPLNLANQRCDYSTDENDDESTDRVSGESTTSDHEDTISFNQNKFDYLTEELNYKSHQLSRQIESIHAQFQEMCDSLNNQDEIIVQLYRQHNYCNELLLTFEDFLVSFEEKANDQLYCGNWFAQVLLLKERFSRFDRNGEIMIQHLNNRMEILFDEFVEHKTQLISDQSIANLNQIGVELRFVNPRISSGELELDDIIDYVTVQIQEQRDLIGQFCEVMSSICQSVESTIVCTEVDEFDCFQGQNFIQNFSRTLSSIQII